MSTDFSQEGRNLDCEVQVSGPLCTTAQIVEVQHAWLLVMWLFGNPTKDCPSVKSDPLVGSLQSLV